MLKLFSEIKFCMHFVENRNSNRGNLQKTLLLFRGKNVKSSLMGTIFGGLRDSRAFPCMKHAREKGRNFETLSKSCTSKSF